jgi:hypothetical protein
MFSVSPVEPMVSLDNDPVSQTDDQCTSAEVCVIESAALVQDVALTSENTSSENITTSSVSNSDALFGALGARELLRENYSRLAEAFTNASEGEKANMFFRVLYDFRFRRVDYTHFENRMEHANFMKRVQDYVATDPTAFGENPEFREFVRRTTVAFRQDFYR